MIEKVKKTMLAYDIFPKKSVLVALSGGADSVALLHIMHTLSQEYGFRVYAAHVTIICVVMLQNEMKAFQRLYVTSSVKNVL